MTPPDKIDSWRAESFFSTLACASALNPINTLIKMTPAWIVYAWPRVLYEAVYAPKLHFAHLSTQVLQSGDARRPACGQTLWLGDDGERQAGVAWDWISLPAGLVAMVDPMSVVTNLQFLTEAGEVLAPLESVRRLNEIVHALPWQYEVQRALTTRH